MPKQPDGRTEEEPASEPGVDNPNPSDGEAVDEESEESFPASDPPSHWGGGVGGTHSA